MSLSAALEEVIGLTEESHSRQDDAKHSTAAQTVEKTLKIVHLAPQRVHVYVSGVARARHQPGRTVHAADWGLAEFTCNLTLKRDDESDERVALLLNQTKV